MRRHYLFGGGNSYTSKLKPPHLLAGGIECLVSPWDLPPSRWHDIYSGEQIKAYITTITAPSCSLCFTGSVRLNGFWVSTSCLKVTLHIDWHNCLLHYCEFAIPLPEKGTVSAFQPNLLTDFS